MKNENQKKPKLKKPDSTTIITAIVVLALGAYLVYQFIPKEGEKKQNEEQIETTTETATEATLNPDSTTYNSYDPNAAQERITESKTTPDMDYTSTFKYYTNMYDKDGNKITQIWQPAGFEINDEKSTEIKIKPQDFDTAVTNHLPMVFTWFNESNQTIKEFETLTNKNNDKVDLLNMYPNMRIKYTRYDYEKIADYTFYTNGEKQAHVWIWKNTIILPETATNTDSDEAVDKNTRTENYVIMTDIIDKKGRHLGCEVSAKIVDQYYLNGRYPTIDALLKNILKETSNE